MFSFKGCQESFLVSEIRLPFPRDYTKGKEDVKGAARLTCPSLTSSPSRGVISSIGGTYRVIWCHDVRSGPQEGL